MTQTETTGQQLITGYDPPDGSPQLSIEDLGAPRPADTPPEEVEEPAAVDSFAMSGDDILAAARGDEGGAAETVAEEEAAGEEDAAEAVEESPAEEAEAEEPAAATGDLPADVDGIIAYCQRVDGGE